MIELSGRDAVRKRPGLYFGQPGGRIENGILIEVLHFAMQVRDAKPRLEIETQGRELRLRGWGQVDVERLSGNWGSETRLSLGTAPAIFLSELVRLQHSRGEVIFTNGDLTAIVTKEPGTDDSWELTIRLDDTVIANAHFPARWAERECRLLAYLHPHWTFALNGGSFQAPGGLADLVADLNWHQERVVHSPIAFAVSGPRFTLDVAIQYADTKETTTVSFANKVMTSEGPHVGSVKQALSKVLANLDPDYRLNGSSHPGLTLAVHAQIEGLEFSGPLRDVVGNPELFEPMLAAVQSYLESAVAADKACWIRIAHHEYLARL